MARTKKHPCVRCHYCGHAFREKECRRGRDGFWYCPMDAAKQHVRGKHPRAHRAATAFEQRQAAHARAALDEGSKT